MPISKVTLANFHSSLNFLCLVYVFYKRRVSDAKRNFERFDWKNFAFIYAKQKFSLQGNEKVQNYLKLRGIEDRIRGELEAIL